MRYYCVLVKGPCRGKMCDFWARVKIRKMAIDDILMSIADCERPDGIPCEEWVQKYWSAIGVRNMELLREEDPELWAKIHEVEERFCD